MARAERLAAGKPRGGAVRPRKGLGQHFLVDPTYRARIVDSARLLPTDSVLEVGPGRGEMTALIAERAGKVVAVELDDRLIPYLDGQFGDRGVSLVHGDILEVDVGSLMKQCEAVPYKVVANLPYYITGAAIRLLLETDPPPTWLVLTVQAEVAERMVARPPRMSLLATSVQYYAHAEFLFRIPAGAFRPAPKVDSGVVRLERINDREMRDVPRDLFFRAVRAGYSQPRKKLRNSFAAGLGVKPQVAAAILEEACIDPDRRAETLSVEDWIEVARSLSEVRP